MDQTIRDTEIFRDLPGAVVERLLRECERLILRRGETLIRQGDPGDCLYLLGSGRLRFFVERKDGVEPLMGNIGPGETVGEMALLTGDPRSASVVAARDSGLLKMTADQFSEMVHHFPGAVLPIVRAILKRQQRLRGASAAFCPTTIALIPTSGGLPLKSLREQLALALGRFRKVDSLDWREVEQAFGAEAATRMAQSPDDETLANWLSRREKADGFLLLWGEPGAEAWNRRCVRQADLVMVWEPADSQIDRSRWVTDLLGDSHSLAPRVDFVVTHRGELPPQRSASCRISDAQLARCHHVQVDSPSDFARLTRAIVNRSVGIVLSGGGAKGFAHIGVMKALGEANLPFDLMGGCSMGALLAAQFACGWEWDEVRDQCRQMWITSGSAFDYTVPIVALLAGRRGAQRLRRMVGDRRMEDLPIPYFCVSANLTSATLATHTAGPLWKAILASASLPGILPPQLMDGSLHCDGGVLDNLPVHAMRTMTKGPVLAVDVGSVRNLTVDPEVDFIPPGGSLLLRKVNPWASALRVPNIFTILGASTLLASSERGKNARELSDLYVRPEIEKFPMFGFEKLDDLIACGYQAMQEQIDAWKAILDQANASGR